jgi:hypothetical protein
MPTREGKPPYGKYDAGAHARQPRGHSIGIHDGPQGHAGQGFEAEKREHFGAMTDKSTPEHNKPVANIPANTEGSALVENCGMGHARQPGGKSIGAGERASHPSGYVRSAHHHDHLSRHVGGKGHHIGKR